MVNWVEEGSRNDTLVTRVSCCHHTTLQAPPCLCCARTAQPPAQMSPDLACWGTWLRWRAPARCGQLLAARQESDSHRACCMRERTLQHAMPGPRTPPPLPSNTGGGGAGYVCGAAAGRRPRVRGRRLPQFTSPRKRARGGGAAGRHGRPRPRHLCAACRPADGCDWRGVGAWRGAAASAGCQDAWCSCSSLTRLPRMLPGM